MPGETASLPRALPLPGLSAGGGVRLDRGNAGFVRKLHLGPFGTGGCAHPVHDAPGSERDAEERASLLRARDDEKRYLPLRGSVYGRRILYEYQPYGGLITSEGNMGEENGFRFSSEYMDGELGLVYHSSHRYQFV